MKSVIIVCLLSLSMCSSVPTANDVTPAPVVASSPTANETVTQKTTVKPEPVASVAPAIVDNATKNDTKAPQQQENATTPLPPHPNDNKIDTKTTDKDNKTDSKTEQDAAKTTVKPTEEPKDKKEIPATPDNKQNDSKPESKDDKESTTAKSAIDASSPAPPVVQASRAFDGASFVGGIILTLGLLAVGFVGFKYYKNQHQRNYGIL